MSRSYISIEAKDVLCTKTGMSIPIRVERGVHMVLQLGVPVAFVSDCEFKHLEGNVRYCSRLEKTPCPYTVDGNQTMNDFFR
jgi:hypothetical protein